MDEPRERSTPDELALGFEASRAVRPGEDLRERLLARARTLEPGGAPRTSRWRPRLLNAAALVIGFLSLRGVVRVAEADPVSAPSDELNTIQTAAELIHGSDHTDTRLLLALANLAEEASREETRR